MVASHELIRLPREKHTQNGRRWGTRQSGSQVCSLLQPGEMSAWPRPLIRQSALSVHQVSTRGQAAWPAQASPPPHLPSPPGAGACRHSGPSLARARLPPLAARRGGTGESSLWRGDARGTGTDGVRPDPGRTGIRTTSPRPDRERPTPRSGFSAAGGSDLERQRRSRPIPDRAGDFERPWCSTLRSVLCLPLGDCARPVRQERSALNLPCVERPGFG
jgi:hypothetical protein